MNHEFERPAIELPDLAMSNFDLRSADLAITTGIREMWPAELFLSGEEDDFVVDFSGAQLRVEENGNSTGDINISGGSISISGSVRGNLTVRGGRSSRIVINDDEVIVNGHRITGGDGGRRVEKKRAKLVLPPGQTGTHKIKTVSGDVSIDSILARRLAVVTESGEIVIRSCDLEVLEIKTMSGDVELEHVTSHGSSTIGTMSGDVEIDSSAADNWNISTMSGDIRARSTKGEFSPSTMSGKVRIK